MQILVKVERTNGEAWSAFYSLSTSVDRFGVAAKVTDAYIFREKKGVSTGRGTSRLVSRGTCLDIEEDIAFPPSLLPLSPRESYM